MGGALGQSPAAVKGLRPAGGQKSKRRTRRPGSVLVTAALWVLALAFVFPVVMTFADSFMGEAEILEAYGSLRSVDSGGAAGFAALRLIPEMATVQQYYTVLIGSTGYLMMFWNSVKLTLPIVAGQLLVGSMAAYAFAVLRFPGRNGLFFAYLLTMLMPFQVTLVPNYLMADRLGLLGTAQAIVLPGVFATFGVFLLRQFMAYVPMETVEAARLDGSGHLGVFLRIVLPLCRPALASLATLSFIDNWSMVEQPIVFLKDANLQPLSLFLTRLTSGAIGVAFAASALFLLPILLVFLYAYDDLVEGIQMSSIKD